MTLPDTTQPTALITGGSGFLGRRLAATLRREYKVIVTGRNHKQLLQAQQETGCATLPLDVTHIEAVRDIFRETRPKVIIHAAATKFVDLAETQPMECVDINVLGSQNVARVAMEQQVSTVIGISTDKAAAPIRNTYGLSKALMERLFCSSNGKTATRFLCVRYGNVAWSTGSVLCIWKRMHKETGVIGTTGPEMRRFFFTVDDAVRLVITALQGAEEFQGQVLCRHMKAALMRDLLETWTSHKGGTWERIEGRPGERSDEYLIGELELPYSRHLLIGGISHYLISFNQSAREALAEGLSSANTERLSTEEMLAIINNPPPEES